MSDPTEVVVEKPAPTPSYSASEITLYGVPLLGMEAFFGFDTRKIFVSMLVTPENPAPAVNLQFALIEGYAYQGHCYSLPEPAIVLVDQSKQLPAQGCGYTNAVGVLGYSMWSVDQKEQTAQLQLTNDFFESVILRKNLPGPKQPGSYNAMMQIAHRGGKLME
jgi:hypothetical protein